MKSQSFFTGSTVVEFHGVLGQYINYRRALRRREPERALYLAVSLGVYNSFFTIDFIQEGLQEEQVKRVVYDPARKEIVKWQK